jgi:hypothetical protein
MNRHEYFVMRLDEMGMYEDDSDYGGMIGESVEQLSSTFADQRHSGMSAVITLGLFNQLFVDFQKASEEWAEKMVAEGWTPDLPKEVEIAECIDDCPGCPNCDTHEYDSED